MSNRQVYKISEKQFKLIVEIQKRSPQLQTEILDRTAGAFTKLLSFGFKQSMNAIRYLAGIGVNVFYGDRYTPTGKFPVKKSNPLAPLSLYQPELAGLPQNYQKLFTTIYTGFNAIDVAKNNQRVNQNDYGGGITNQGKHGGGMNFNYQNIKKLDEIVDNLKFDDVKDIVYQIKFKFQNLKKEAKENAELMMTTWSLIFNVNSEGNVSNNNTMQWELVGFNSQGPSIGRFLSMATKKENNNNEDDRLLRALSQYASAPTNQLSLIFSNQGQAGKFAKVMKTQIDTHMKIMIGQLNAQMGSKDVIKQPTVSVIVNPILIGDSKIQPQNQKGNMNDIENDMNEILRQIKIYQDQDQYQDYINKLKYILNKLAIQRKQLQNKT